MRGTAVRWFVITGAVLAAAWPASSYAQPTATPRTAPAPPAAEAHPQHDPQHPDPTTPQEPPSTAAGQTTDAQAGQGTTQPLTPIPPITDADRAAAFPDVEGHTVQDNALHSFVLFDQLEWQAIETGGGLNWDAKGWLGRDRDRLWFRTEGQAEDGRLGDAEAHLLYGRAFARWWEVVVGLRQDVRPGPSQSWLAFGVQGLAPSWFDIEATVYLSDAGHTAARLEVEYELLMTNRLILQPLVEVDLYGKSNAERGIGAGVSDVDAGLRMRYEFRREFAPYVGVTWRRTFGRTTDFAEAAGQTVAGLRFVAGLRLWY